MRRYKARAVRAFPREYLEVMFGSVHSDRTAVEKLVQIPQRSTRMWVTWKCDEEYEDLIAATEASSGLEYIGTIHSHTATHPEASIPSPADNHSAQGWEEKVFAIDLVTKGKDGKFTHAVCFYRPQNPLLDVGYF